MAITKTDAGTILTAPHTTGVWHLIQWKHAIRLEGLGIKIARRSVTAHAKRVLGIRGSRTEVIAEIQRRIDAYMLEHPADQGEASNKAPDFKKRAANDKDA